MTLVSPTTGLPLRPDTAHSLTTDSGERWPVVDHIPYLRVGSQTLVQAALDYLDSGDETAALVLLLAENDRWWTEPAPSSGDLAALVRDHDNLSLRTAMDLLGFGRVGTYFAHRWSDPTFMAGLALIDTHWSEPKTAFDLACGIGHYVRALQNHSVVTTGADVVFAKLWLARHWVVGPDAPLVCFDADQAWPVTGHFDLVSCQDAFYFFSDKHHIASRLKALAEDGQLVIGHVHNAASPQFSGGAGVALSQLQDMFPGAIIHDDQKLTEAYVAGVRCLPLSGPDEAEAFGLVYGRSALPDTDPKRLLLRPADGVRLVRNPLCIGGAPAWPSARYEEEYAKRATYTCAAHVPANATMGPQWLEAVARGDLLDLPERW